MRATIPFLMKTTINPFPIPLGRMLATPGVLLAFGRTHETPDTYLARHESGDWGDVDEEDKAANDVAALQGTRLLSAYTLGDGKTKIWIITEADRSATTVLLPNEY